MKTDITFRNKCISIYSPLFIYFVSISCLLHSDFEGKLSAL